MQAEAADTFESMGDRTHRRIERSACVATISGCWPVRRVSNRPSAPCGASGVPVIAVGFGETAAIDENALKRLSRRYYLATDYQSLQRVFVFTRTMLNNRLTATISSPFADPVVAGGPEPAVPGWS